MNKLSNPCCLAGLQEGTKMRKLVEHLAQKMKPFGCNAFVNTGMHTGMSLQGQARLQSRGMQSQARDALR